MALVPLLSPLFLSILPLLFLTLSPVSCSSPWLFANSSSFLTQIVDALTEKEKWDPKSEVRFRVSDSDDKVSKVGVLSRYELNAKVGRRLRLGMKFSDEAVQWRRVPGSVVVQSDSDLVAGDEAGLVIPVVKDLELTGPLELRVGMEGRVDDWISLNLTSINVTNTSLKRLLVPYGIKIKVVGAQEISITNPSDIGLSMNGILATQYKYQIPFLHHRSASCAPLLSVHVVGSILVTAHKTLNPISPIQTSFVSHDMVQLLTDKCYYRKISQISSCLFSSIPSFNSRLAMLERVLVRLVGSKVLDKKFVRFVKARVVSLTVVKFRLFLERELSRRDKYWKEMEAWRTKPKKLHFLLEVVASISEDGTLKVLLVKRVKKSLRAVESTAWSSLMSNISFTQFPSFVLPPEALTLDVKW
ncbi:hypothetical protein LUZ63_001437 [Rhynchospora breviuscula]|uniref:Uncharacterized protein n=1 Tax=Rhynchospora breviuscula TaxID=2022672 RepID=A0A9Q0CXC7_9POAL|nr:hypothetical protein LUZ63_001437 [Rhynchospora breviuscula]